MSDQFRPGDRFITNLESDDKINQAVDAAMTDFDVKMALARQEGHLKTWDLMRSEFGAVSVGPPRKTKFKTAETLTQQGYVGVYRDA